MNKKGRFMFFVLLLVVFGLLYVLTSMVTEQPTVITPKATHTVNDMLDLANLQLKCKVTTGYEEGKVNMYLKPAYTNDPLETISEGTELLVLEEQGSWFEVEEFGFTWGNNYKGWINSKYCVIQN